MKMTSKLEQYCGPVAIGLLLSSWISLAVSEAVQTVIFLVAFSIMLFSLRARNSRSGWGGILGFGSPLQRFLTLGFWATLLGTGAYRYVLGGDLDTTPTIIAITAIIYLPWPFEHQRAEYQSHA